MRYLVSDSIVEVVTVVGSALMATAVTIAGVLAEQAGIRNVLTGHVALGAWELWMGAVALFFGVYLLGYREFWRRLTRFAHGSGPAG